MRGLFLITSSEVDEVRNRVVVDDGDAELDLVLGHALRRLRELFARDVAPSESAASNIVTTQMVTVERRVVRVKPMRSPPDPWLRLSVRPQRRFVPSSGPTVCAGRTHGAAVLTIIGGGSYQWTPKLLVDFVNTPALRDAEIVLHDIDPAPLPRMVALAAHLASVRGIDLDVRRTRVCRTGPSGQRYARPWQCLRHFCDDHFRSNRQTL